jgi:hypothetical protein
VKTSLALILTLLVAAHPVAAQSADSAALWRAFAEKLEVGAVLKIRTHDGQSFTATLVQVQADAIQVQPRMRLAVPVQPVPYDAIASLERARNGIGPGKAAAIGIATGVGAFFVTLLIFVAAAMD